MHLWYTVCAWICLGHSRCSVNISWMGMLWYSRMCTCLLYNQWLRKNQVGRRDWLYMAVFYWDTSGYMFLDSGWGLLSYFHSSSQGLHTGIAGCPLGVYLAGLPPILVPWQEKKPMKQPRATQLVSGGAETAPREVWESQGVRKCSWKDCLDSELGWLMSLPARGWHSG